MRFLRFAAGAALALSFSVLSSCYPFIGSLPSGAVDGPTIQHVPYSGSFSYTVETGTTPRDVYFVFTNPDRAVDLSAIPTFASGSITVNGKSLPAPVAQALPSVNSAPTTMTERVAEFNRDPRAYIASGGIPRPQPLVYISGQPANLDAVGQTKDFVLDIDAYGNPTVTVPATCQYAPGPVVFADGRTRALSIWVANNMLAAITPTMVTELVKHFLQKPESLQDIYHWDTAVVGEPWAHMSSADYINWDSNQTITILLANLNASYTPGSPVTVGYYWAKDNYTTAYVPGSNQRIMFYIDATLYATVLNSETGTGWLATNYWPKIVFSTLAHEFQHMIQFYQKQIVQGATKGTDTWINEMCSMLMEDLVADKQGVEGPRGVPLSVTNGSAGSPGIVDGRIPGFNQSSSSALVVTAPPFDLTDYSVAYAFGAWLARNYGGAALLQRIVQCPQIDETAVVNAVIQATGNQKESLASLLERWAAAVLLSDTTTAPSGYRYNAGTWFTSSIGGETFDLGSIDFFNYTPTLKVFSPTGTQPTTSYHSANLYYKAAASFSGSKTWNITVPAGIAMNVVIQ